MEANGKTGAVILANGDFPWHEIPLEILKNSSFLVCTDGSACSLYQSQQKFRDDARLCALSPKAVIGDGDSLPEDLKNHYKSVFFQEKEQDTNDLTKATNYCIRQGYKNITYLGVGGKREDHTVANFSLLMFYFKNFSISLAAYTDYGRFIPCRGDCTFKAEPGQQVSVFNFGCEELASTGLKWDLYDFDELWQGTLNEALSDSFTIKADGYYLVYITYDRKKKNSA